MLAALLFLRHASRPDPEEGVLLVYPVFCRRPPQPRSRLRMQHTLFTYLSVSLSLFSGVKRKKKCGGGELLPLMAFKTKGRAIGMRTRATIAKLSCLHLVNSKLKVPILLHRFKSLLKATIPTYSSMYSSKPSTVEYGYLHHFGPSNFNAKISRTLVL